MNDSQRSARQTPYAFGTMTFIFGLAIGAVLGGLLFMNRDNDPEPTPIPAAGQPTAEQFAAIEDEVVGRDLQIDDLQAELERMQRELEEAAEGGDGEPGDVELLRDEAAAKQLEIDSLSLELGEAYEQLGRLTDQQASAEVAVHYLFVLEEMHGFAQGGFVDPALWVDDNPALDDVLAEIDDAELTDAVIIGILESSPANTDPLFSGLQQVLNHMQDALVR